MSNTPPRVLIVGGGPSGLICALSLIHNGVPVRIIDKNTEARHGQRGAGIMPRSLELFNNLGVAEKILKLAIRPPPTRRYELPHGIRPIGEFEVSPHVEPTPSRPFPNIVLLGQNRLEDIIRATLAEYSCTVEVGTELVSFIQTEHGVDVKLVRHGADGSDVEGTPEFSNYDWLIGADGARGVVRKMSGFTFLGETRTIETHVVGDIYVDKLTQKYWHMWGDASSMLISLRPTETPCLFSFIVAGPEVNHAHLSSDEAALRRCFIENTGLKTNIKFKEMPWVNHYIPNIRMVQTFQKGKIFLVGDSAHVHSFSGGQGMNTGIQDAYNLGWKLALVQRGLAPPALLDTYSEERLPVIREMLNRTTKILERRFTEKTSEAWHDGGGLLQLGINCRWSSLVVDERQKAEDADFADFGFDNPYGASDDLESIDVNNGRMNYFLRAGDRAPDASGLLDLSVLPLLRVPNQSLFRYVFGPSYHTVLIFTPAHGQCPGIILALKKYPCGTVRSVIIVQRGRPVPYQCQGVHAVLEDQEDYAHESYGIIDSWSVVVVRPDGVIGAIVGGVEGLQTYFSGIFG